MRSRQWLIEKGLAKPGRGRLSVAAKNALAKAISEGMKFSDQGSEPIKVIKPAKADNRIVAAPLEARAKIRDQRVVWGIDRGSKPGQEDLIICFNSCAECGRSIQYCSHATPRLPNWLKSETYLTKPEI